METATQKTIASLESLIEDAGALVIVERKAFAARPRNSKENLEMREAAEEAIEKIENAMAAFEITVNGGW